MVMAMVNLLKNGGNLLANMNFLDVYPISVIIW